MLFSKAPLQLPIGQLLRLLRCPLAQLRARWRDVISSVTDSKPRVASVSGFASVLLQVLLVVLAAALSH